MSWLRDRLRQFLQRRPPPTSRSVPETENIESVRVAYYRMAYKASRMAYLRDALECEKMLHEMGWSIRVG